MGCVAGAAGLVGFSVAGRGLLVSVWSGMLVWESTCPAGTVRSLRFTGIPDTGTGTCELCVNTALYGMCGALSSREKLGAIIMNGIACGYAIHP